MLPSCGEKSTQRWHLLHDGRHIVVGSVHRAIWNRSIFHEVSPLISAYDTGIHFCTASVWRPHDRPPPPKKKTFSASNIVFKGDLFPVYLYKCSFGVQFLVVLETSSRESVLRVTSSRAHTRALSAFPALLLSRSSEVWTKLTVYCYKKIQHSTAQLNLLLQWTKRANILSRPRIAVFIITTIPGW